MAEYSKVASGSFITVASTPKTINLPFQPQIVKLVNFSASAASPAANSYISAYWGPGIPQGDAVIVGYNGSTVLVGGYVAANGISTFSRGLSDLFGPQQQVIGLTKNSNTPNVNVANHGYSVGDVVVFEGLYQSSNTGMPQICGPQFFVDAVVDANNFTIIWNTNQSNYTALSGSPSGAFVKKVLNPAIYSPGSNVIEAIGDNANNTADIYLTSQHNLSVGSQISFRIPSQWGAVQLNSNPAIPGFGPVYATVLSILNNYGVRVSLLSGFYSAYNSNIPVLQVPGLTFPQIATVGDMNTGGGLQSVNGIPTVNGPTINGAFLNNTCMGFTVGAQTFANQGNQLISWEALYCDYVINS